jgi:hypothetical protein
MHISQRAIAASAAMLTPLLGLWAQTNDPYEGSLDRSAARGVQTITYPVPSGGPDEICVVPQHLPSGNYRGKDGEKDVADEKRLASYDFYKVGNTPDNGAVAICPKSKSTSAAVELIEIPTGNTKPSQESASYCSALEKSGKTLAKFKQTDNAFTTTSTAAVLGYYHLSRVLGDICEIRPAVLRTMDIKQHKSIVKLAADMGIHGTVGKSWDLFNKYYTNPRGSSVARTLFTSDFAQIYGALIENTSGEENYAEWLRAGTNLSTTQAFRHMADTRPIKAIVGSTQFSQQNVQTLVAMRDMSEMILIDYLMAQSDRLTGGNISDYNFIYFIDGGHVKGVNAHKADDVPANVAKVTVKKLTIKDTDAGLLNENVFEQKGYISQISHMHPDTYNRLIVFAQKWKEDSAAKDFFHKECTFSMSQLARFEKYLLAAAAMLQTRHGNGKLLLDLDLDGYFQPGTSSSPSPTP